LRKQPVTLHTPMGWYKIKKMEAVFIVPKNKNPKSINLHKDYYQIIKDENEQLTRLMASAEVGDRLYFEKIEVGADFTFGIVVEIIDNPVKSTGYSSSKDQNLNENIFQRGVYLLIRTALNQKHSILLY